MKNNNSIAFYIGSFKPPHKGHFDIVKYALKKYNKLIIIISIKARNNITINNSNKIWKIYLKLLPKTKQNKIKIILSNDKSPILTLIKIINKKKYKNIFLLKSTKDKNNKRYNYFKKYPNIKNDIIPLKYNISSTNIRQYIKLNKIHLINNINKFIPHNISLKNKQKIINILMK